MSRGLVWLTALLVLAAVVGFQLGRGAPDEPLPVLYTLGGDFTLQGTHGQNLSLSELEGRMVLLNFGYTGCPDVCPTALARMRDALEMADIDASRIQPLFVTLDPEVDTVDRMGPYVRFFDPDLIGLTGSATDVAAAAEPFKVYYERVPAESGQGYSITHSSHIYLLDTAGRVRATFGESIPVPKIAAAINRLAREGNQLAWSDAS